MRQRDARGSGVPKATLHGKMARRESAKTCGARNAARDKIVVARYAMKRAPMFLRAAERRDFEARAVCCAVARCAVDMPRLPDAPRVAEAPLRA